MSSLSQLRQFARDIFNHALSAVDPVSAVRRALRIDGLRLEVCGDMVEIGTRPIYAIAIGKAAASMATGLDDVLGDGIAGGVLTGPMTHSFSSQCWQTFAGGHPTPNDQSFAAAQAAFTLLDRANEEHAVVVALISGGGSAMMEWPASRDIKLADLRRANQLLVNCGASINEINVVRRAFSAVKGGGLMRRAPNAKFVTLIVSDTNKGDEASVASGPTLETPGSGYSALEVVHRYELEATLPDSILKSIREFTPKSTITKTESYVLLDNETALNAAAIRARELEFSPVMASDICEQAVDAGCHQLVDRIKSLPGPVSLISGGEFSCRVHGDGQGGRNLETALRCAQLLEGFGSHVVVLSAGTDGIDGNSPAAGAVADETTTARGRVPGLSADDHLERSDSYGFFEKLNDEITTGPTGTNVRDVRIMLKE